MGNLVIDSSHYKSLWVILNSDKRNKKVILDFINTIPLVVYKEIKKSLDDCKNNNESDLYSEKVINGIVYYFKIDSSDGSICFAKFSKKKIEDNDIFMMKLYPYSDNFDKEISLGSLIYQMKDKENIHVWDCDEIQYKLVKNLVGIFLVKFSNYAVFFQKKIKKIDIELLSDIVDIKSLSTCGVKLVERVHRRRSRSRGRYVDVYTR